MVADSPSLPHLRLSAEGVVGRLVLDRPAKLNALSPELLQSLIDAARWFDAEAAVKVVIVSGEGRAFSAGADLGAFTSAPADADAWEAIRSAPTWGARWPMRSAACGR